MNKKAVLIVTALIALSFSLTARKSVAGGPAVYKPGDKIADFVLKDERGKTVKLSEYRGKTVILNFYASW